MNLQRQAACIGCGDPVAASDWTVRKVSKNPETGRAETNSVKRKGYENHAPTFMHADGLKRDHQAMPDDFREPHEDLARQAHSRGMAEAQVDHTLKTQMMGIEVDHIFRDRR